MIQWFGVAVFAFIRGFEIYAIRRSSIVFIENNNIFSTQPMRAKFLPQLPRLFSEKLMIGIAYTCHDTIKWAQRTVGER